MSGADPAIAALRAKAERGNSVAQYYLGLVYAEGRAVPKDSVEAFVWLSLAAENGSKGKDLGLLVAAMSVDQLDAARFRLDERRRITPGVVAVRQADGPAASTEELPAALQQEIASLCIEKAEFSDELAAARKEADGAKKATEATEQRVRQVESDLSAIRARNTELITANQKLDEQAHAAAGQIDAAAQTKTALGVAEQRARQAEASLVTLQRERDEQGKSLAAVQTSAAGLTAQIKKLGDEKTALAQANGRLEEQAQTGTRQAEQAERASKSAVADQTQKLAGLTAELATARTGLVTAQGANADLAAQLKKLADEKALLTQQAARSGEAGQEAALLKTKLGQVESDLSAIRARNAELVAANQKLDEQARGAAGQIDAAAQTKAALVTAEQRARQAEASLVTLQRERDNLRQQLEAADRNLAAAQTAAASRAGENTRQLAELQLQLQQAKEELAELHSQNQSLHETSQRLEHEDKETADALRQLAEAQTALEQMKHENSSLQAQRAGLAARLAQEASAATAPATLAAAGAGSVAEVARLKEELRRAEGKVEMTVRSFALARQENERLKAQIEQASTSTAQNHVADAALAGARQVLGTVRAEANRAAAESASARDTLRQVQGANVSLATENAYLKTAVPVAGGDLPAGSGTPPGHPAMETSFAPPPAASTAPPEPAPRTHRVVSGDTLTRISNRYYGTSSRWQDIYDANRDKLRSADVLPLDVELRIP